MSCYFASNVLQNVSNQILRPIEQMFLHCSNGLKKLKLVLNRFNICFVIANVGPMLKHFELHPYHIVFLLQYACHPLTLGWYPVIVFKRALRTVPTFITAHTFCVSRDIRVSNGWYLLIQGYFCAVSNYAEKAELTKCSWHAKRKLGVTMHFSVIIKLQNGKKRHTLLCILLIFLNIVAYLSLKNAWLPPIFFLDFKSPC